MQKRTSNSYLVSIVLFIFVIISIVACNSSMEDDSPELMVEEQMEEEETDSDDGDTMEEESRILSNVTLISKSLTAPLSFYQLHLNPTENTLSEEEIVNFVSGGNGRTRVVGQVLYAHNTRTPSFFRKNLQTGDSQLYTNYFDHTVGESIILNVANTSNFNLTLFNDFDVQSLGHVNIVNTHTLATTDIQVSEPNGLFGISGEDRIIAKDNLVLVADARSMNPPPESEIVFDIRIIDLNSLSEVARIQNVISSLFTIYEGNLLRVNPNNGNYDVFSIPSLELIESGAFSQIPASKSVLFSYKQLSNNIISFGSRGFLSSKYLSIHNFNSGQSQLLWDPVENGSTIVSPVMMEEFGLSIFSYNDVIFDQENNVLIVGATTRRIIGQEIIEQDIVIYIDATTKNILYHKILGQEKSLSSMILEIN